MQVKLSSRALPAASVATSCSMELGLECWYALHTKPHKERQVEAFLQGRGIQIYFPTIPSPKRSRSSDERAFFPSYLFARTDLEAVGLWTLHYAPGMRGVVMFGGVPARVDERVIAMLQARLADVEVVDALGEALNPGDRVVITQGPFAELEAVFDRRLSAEGRVRVLIEFLRRTTPVELDARALRKTSRLPQRGRAI
jgi:transcriptional antiterminator RfaH